MARTRHRPKLLEESKVYLYTSIEPGINISAVQGLGAGCIPVTPRWEGGIAQQTGIGYTYQTVDDAVDKVKRLLKTSDSPLEISWKAKVYSSESFEEAIQRTVKTISTTTILHEPSSSHQKLAILFGSKGRILHK